jgi:hypothetical protein
MTTVFVGGSRHVSRLNAAVTKRIDNMIAQDLDIIVGDANGADRVVQSYLYSKRYSRVVVFCAEGACRNNVGDWKVREVPAETRERTAEFYSAKDRVMALEAAVGLMLWDGKSIGTLMNVYRLLSLGKKAVVYTVPEKAFTEFHTNDEWELFITHRDRPTQEKLRVRAALEGKVSRKSDGQSSLFEHS